jgi:hypothetical protein
MPKVTLFDTSAAMKLLQEAAMALRNSEDKKRSSLGGMLGIIASNAADFDERCQGNIAWVGNSLMGYLDSVKALPDEKLDLIFAIVYRFFVEYDLSIKGELSIEVRQYFNIVSEIRTTLSNEAQSQIEYARQEMPISILKNIINSDEIGSLRNVSSVAYVMEQKIDSWEKKIAESEAQAIRLSEALAKNTQAFNFVGLHEGFGDLSKHIIRELRFSQVGIAVFGLCVLVPGATEIWMSSVKGIDLSKMGLYNLIAAAVGTVTLTLLFLYFFRIALRKADSCAAQLLQVRLRMSLCKFIQSYADYSSGIKEKNSDALAKFEALIFSGIVGNEDKLPSTFDGLEQLSALAKSLRGRE